MIFQAVLNNTASTTLTTPFQGIYRVKLLKIEYHITAGAAIQQELCQLTSNTLINQTPLSGRIIFLNTAANNSGYNTDFVIGDNVMIANQLDLTVAAFGGGALPAGAGGYNSLLVTLDFEKVENKSSLV